MIRNFKDKQKQGTKVAGQAEFTTNQVQINKKLESLIKQYIQSPNFQDWTKLSKIINIKNSNPMFAFMFNDLLRLSVNQIKSFPMFMYLYSLYKNKTFKNFPYIRWQRLYNDVCLNQKQIVIFNSWVQSAQTANQQTHQIIMETLKMVAQNFNGLLQNQRINISDIEFQSLIEWIIFMKTQKESDFEITCNLVKVIKEARMIQTAQFVSKGHMVLKKVFQNLGKFQKTSGNCFLLLDSQIFKQKDIDYFCNIYYEFLTDLDQQHILRVFKGLTISGITKEVLILISQIIHSLQNNQEYFKLRIIYQEFVLPVLCQKLKTHKTLCDEIYEICQFCIIGFIKHCFIGVAGLNCILKNIQLFKSQKLTKKWIQLGIIVEQFNRLQNQPDSLFNKNKFDVIIDLKKQKFDIGAYKVWQVTLRTGRKHKKYNKSSSNLRGIQNQSNQCYIISVVQSLYMTKQLQKVIEEYKQNIKGNLLIMDQLRMLFAELDGRIKSKVIVVNYLKEKGPQQFATSPHQEDVQQYLLALFQVIEKQITKNPPLLKKFKETFQINCKSVTNCLNCGNQFVNIQNQYVHTIPHTKSLQFKIQQHLQDYQCLNCHKKQCKNIRIIQPRSKIFIVHINRFSHKNGVLRKQLSNQTIRRKFKDYELQGMICHIGKNMQNGHYIYFSRIGQKKWVQMNDRLTWQFDLQKDEQEFQREMQTQLTPYILFYKRLHS